MSNDEWAPPKRLTDLLDSTKGNVFSAINSTTAGPRSDEPLPPASTPGNLQLYSLATPNGQKVGIVLEELGIAYDAFVISLAGQQFSQGFYDVNPNSKIPAALDFTADGVPVRLFESGSIALYLAEKYDRFLPKDPVRRAECINWCFWQVGGQGPMVRARVGVAAVMLQQDACRVVVVRTLPLRVAAANLPLIIALLAGWQLWPFHDVRPAAR
jgi:GST-like protein